MASAMSFSTPTTLFHQPAARRPTSFSSQPRFLLYPSSTKTLIKNRLSLPPASRDPAPFVQRHRAGSNGCIRPIVPNNTEVEEPNEMARLITLVLQPRSHHKRESAYLSLLETLNDFLHSKNPPATTLPTKTNRRSSIALPSTVVYTKEEWKEAMEEVKSLFRARHFKKCSSRCKHLLDQIHNQPQRQPIYTTYLCFYAALSLEQTARSLYINSDSKLPLFYDSLAHYQKAKVNLSSTSFIIPRKISRPSKRSPTRSISSSNRSSLESLFSQFSLSGPDISAPDKYPTVQQNHRRNTSSVSSAIMKPAPLRIQKKVSFSDSLPTFITQQAPKSHDENWDLINSFPMPPSPSNCPSLMDSSGESEDEDLEVKTRENAAAVQRFQLHLNKFSGQLDWHINAINTQISVLEEVARKQKEVVCAAGELAEMKNAMEDEARRAVLKKKIDQRRREKWERKKFDAKRYQELCERALSEVDGPLSC